MAQGFGIVEAAATPKDYSITLRGIRFTPGEFSDLEVGPLSALGSRLGAGDWANGMTEMVAELYRSLRTIYGEVIDQFYNPATGRLTLHTPELLLLANAAMEKLGSDPHYRAGQEQAESTLSKLGKGKAKLEAGQAFAGAVAAKLAPEPVAEPNPAEVELRQELATMARIDQIQQELALLRAESGV